MGTASSLHNKEKESSEQNASDEYTETQESTVENIAFRCVPCSTAGERVEADGFCVDCQEYLCRVCFKSHSRNKLSKSHTLLNKEAMPGIAVITCDPCKVAGDENEAKGYCSDCKEYLCKDCFMSHSRNKLSRHHILLDKNTMPGVYLRETISSLRSNDDAEGQKYNEEYTRIKTWNVKMESDEQDCYITGIALVSDAELVLTDESNKAVKLCDMKNRFIRCLRLKSVPNRITAISYDQVGVVLRNNCKILIISIPERLAVIRTLQTDGVCVDVEHINARLYISFRQPVKFQILQLTGVILNTIEPGPEALQYCVSPSRFAVSPDERLLFVSDRKSNTYMSMDLDGNVKSLLSSHLNSPCDVIISPYGLVYLCNRGKHIIYKMTSDSKAVTVILTRDDGLANPMAMGLDVSKRRLYVSSGNHAVEHSNFIKVFKCE